MAEQGTIVAASGAFLMSIEIRARAIIDIKYVPRGEESSRGQLGPTERY